MKTLLSRAALAAAAMALGLSGAQAGTTMTVKLSVTGSCSVSSFNVGLGELASPEMEETPHTAVSVSVNCSPANTLYTLSFDGGGAYSDGFRHMTTGAKQIKYGLYRDGGYTNHIAEGQGIQTTNASVSVYLQAWVPPGTAIGNYQDIVNLTLTY